MGVTLRFLACGEDASMVTAWLEQHGGVRPPWHVKDPTTKVFYFPAHGPVSYLPSDGGVPAVDGRHTPIISLDPPRQLRGRIWSAGEIRFLPSPLRKACPGLYQTYRDLLKWLSLNPEVHPKVVGADAHVVHALRGALRNYDSRIFALASATAAVRTGALFVDSAINPETLDRLCRELSLLGLPCLPTGA